MEFPQRYEVALTPKIIEANWPNLVLGVNAEIDSLKDLKNNRYNCVAFAVGEENIILDMLTFSQKVDLTPSGLRNDPLEHTLEAYITLFRYFYQFDVCQSSEVEDGFSKIALYEGIDEDGELNFLHVALQRNDGTWKSKLGTYEDIIHNTLDVLEGNYYGTSVVYMKRVKNVVVKILSV